MPDSSAHATAPSRIRPRRFVLGHRAQAGAQGRLWSALQGARTILDGMGTPGVIALVLALTTLLLEDFVRVPLLSFTAWVLVAVALWTAGLYAVSVAIGQTVAHTLGVPPAVAVALPIVALALAVPLLRKARQRLQHTAS